MLEMSRRAMLAGTLASTPAWPLPVERPAMAVEDVVVCARHALDLTDTDAWLVARRLIWSTGGPRQFVTGIGTAIRATDKVRSGLFDASHTLPGSAIFAVYSGGLPGGVWRPVAGGCVTVRGVRMAAFAAWGRSACLVQSHEAPVPMEIVLNG